ncbi:MAG: hypothetical protein JXA54_08330 [Candidatus Heimdallarchaeota archaeon]|nr:hypothetical protein [Candidatus Heimdallarchaeota archaeon]
MSEKIEKTISKRLLGKKVTFTGIARDSKTCACILLEDNQIIYLPSQSSWEDEYYSKKIIITGRLRKKKMIPDVEVAKDGAISQGAFGRQYILQDISFITLNE